MNSNQIQEMVLSEIEDRWDLSNTHDVDLNRSLIQPQKTIFWDESGIDPVELWGVLEEDPIKQDGYKIVFDERPQQFGLACIIAGKGLTFLGPYGSFVEAFESM